MHTSAPRATNSRFTITLIALMGILASVLVGVVAPSGARADEQSVTGSIDATSAVRYVTSTRTIEEAGNVAISLDWTGSADLDLYVRNGAGVTTATSATSAELEQVTVHAAAGETLTMTIKATNGSADYTLTSDDTTTSILGTTDASSQAWSTHEVVVDEDGWLSAGLSDDTAGDLALYLTDATGTILASSQTSVGTEVLTHPVSAGTYLVKVRSVAGATAWTLDVTTQTGTDVVLRGTSDPAGSKYRAYPVVVADDGLLTADATWQGSGDLSMWLRTTTGTVLETAKFEGAEPESVSREVAAGTYEVLVAAEDDATVFDVALGQQTGPDRSWTGNIGFNYIGNGPRQVYDSFDLDVPAGATVATTLASVPAGGGADLDLFVRRIDVPGSPMVDYSTTSLAPEQATFTTNEPGTYRFFVKATSGATGFQLDADVQNGDDVAIRGTVQATGGRQYRTYAVEVAEDATLDAVLDWDTAADLDLYLRDDEGTIVASSSGPGAPTEDISFDVAAGSWQLTVKAQTGAAPFSLDVTTTSDVGDNEAAVVDQQADVTVDEDAEIDPIQLTATDADGDDVTFDVTGLPQGLSADDAGLVSGTPTVPGDFEVSATANDGTVDSDSMTFTITVGNVNDLPVLDPIDDVTLTEDLVIDPSIQPSATDEDGDDLDWFVSGLPANLVQNPGTGEITGTPIAPGSYEVDVFVRDGEGSSSTESFTITVDNVNDVPVLDAIEDASATEDVALDDIQASAADGDIDEGVDETLTFTATGLPEGVSIDEDTGLISGTPIVSGTFEVAVTVTDGDNATDTVAFILTVEGVNDAPVVNPLGDITVVEDQPIAPVAITATDDDGDDVTLSVTSLPAGLTFDDVANEIVGTPTAGGTVTVTVVANDGSVDSEPVAFDITVSEVNDAPVLAAQADVTIDEDSPASIQLEATDEESGTVIYTLVAGALPEGLALDPLSGEISGTPVTPGASTVQVQATDTQAASEVVEFTITVAPVNDAPVVDALADVATDEDAPIVDIVVAATDEEGDDVTFTVAGLPTGVEFDGTDTISGTPTLPGDFSVEVVANDGTDDSVAETFTLSVTPVNDAPVVDDETFEIAEDAAVDTVVGAVSAADEDDTDLTYAITAGNGDETFAVDAATGEITLAQALDFETTEQYLLDVEVSDGELVGDATITIDVTDVVEIDPCTPISTLDCSDLAVDTPYELDFDGTEGGLADTGFTLVDAPSDRDAVDQAPAPATPSFPDVIGYEPSLLTVDGDTLTIDATKGIQYATPTPVNGQQTSGTAGINAQLNGLGVAVAGGADSYELTTTLVAPVMDTPSGNSHQGGLWWFVDEDTYVKLVVVRVNDTAQRVQLAVESLDAPTADDPDGFTELNGPNIAQGVDVALRMVVDADTGLVTAFYDVDGAGEVQLANGADTELIVPSALLDGVALDAGLAPTVNAGVFATKRAADAGDSLEVTFADFGVEAFSNTAPTVEPIEDVTLDEDVELAEAIQVVAIDAEDDILTYASNGLPTGLTLAGDTGAITGTPTVPGEYPVTVTVNDGNGNETEVSFTITVAEVNDAPALADETVAVAEDAAVDTVITTLVGTDEETPGALTYAITAGNDDGDLALDSATGELTVAQALDYDVTPQYVLTVEVSDGEMTGAATITVAVTEVIVGEPCEPFSTLPCDQLAVDTPYSLDFDGSEGGLADTGFTVVDPPSNRDDTRDGQDPAPATPSFPDVPGYEPGLLTVDGDLTIEATQGINYAQLAAQADPGEVTSTNVNSQLNALGVPVPAGDDTYELTTTLIGPDFAGGNNAQQAGLLWFADEDNFVKLVVARQTGENRVQLAVESLDAPTVDDTDGVAEINTVDTFAAGQDVTLRMEIDMIDNVVRGFYTVADGEEVALSNVEFGDDLLLPSVLVDGASLDDGLDPTINAGVFTTKRREAPATDVTATFADFAVTSTEPAPNTPPTIEAIADATATEGIELDPAIQVVADDVDVDDVLTYAAAGLPAGLSIAGETGLVSGTPTEAGTFEVTVTVNDGTDTAQAEFTVTVDPAAPGDPCHAISTLPCDDVTVALPHTADFGGTGGGLADVDGDDTGFTMAQAPSNKEAGDPDPTVAEVPGYVAGQLDVDADALTIGATNGLAFRQLAAQGTPNSTNVNSQQNTLGVGFDASTGPITIETTVDVNFPGNNNFQQAGLWFGLDEDNYVKLVARETSDGGEMTVELLREINADEDGNSTVTSNLVEGPVTLIMEVDPTTGTVTGSYQLEGESTPTEVDSFGATPQSFFDGVALPDGESGDASFAGVFTSARRAAVADRIDATFTNFAIDGPATGGNNAPVVAPIDDVTVVVDEAIAPIQVDATDADLDILTYTAAGLPTGLVIDQAFGEISGTPTETGTFEVTATVDDGTTTTDVVFDVVVVADAPDFTANVNFNEETGQQPAGYELDYGLPYGDRGNGLTYGWVEAADGTTPLDLTGGERGNGRDRGSSQSDQRLDSLVHMQADDITSDGDTFTGVDVEGIWELAVPNGTYEVTVAAGDPNLNNYTNDPEVHALNVEGTQAIAPFEPVGTAGADGQHDTGTVTVTVTDGLLTIDADGGTNTKIDYVDVVATGPAQPTSPEVLLTGDRTLFAGQGTIIPVDTFDEEGDDVTVTVEGLPAGLAFNGTDIAGIVDPAALAGSPYTVEVTGDDGTEAATTTETFEIEVVDEFAVDVNFQDEDPTVVTPDGYLADVGDAYGDRGNGLTYGWVAEGTTTPMSLVGNGRDRDRTSGAASTDQRLDTIMHMQYGDIGTVYDGNPNCTTSVCDAGAWELAVPDGLYEVTLSVGDEPGTNDVYDSLHAINIESGLAILEFQADAGQEYLEVTAQAGVEDGRLTINAIGGANTKINYVQVRSLGTQPIATQMIPPNRATDVAIDSAVSASVSVPGTGVGVNPDRATSLTDEAVKLFKVTPTGEVEVDGNRGSTGGNDTIAFSAQPALEYDTTYRYVIDGVEDEAGNTFGRFQSTFSTETEPDDPDPSVCAENPTLPECQFTPVEGVDFEKVLIPEASGANGKFIASMEVHQGHLWYTTVGQGMYRHQILADGELGPQQDLGVLAGRAAIGLVFDQDDPDVAWVTHATANLSNEGARTGSKVSRVDFSNPASPVVQDIFVNLPRSQKDHLSNSMIYGPTGDGGGDWLYFLQGSNQAAGDTDGAWGSRGETQLTAALLRFDPQDVLAEVAANGPIDVATPEVGGSYDPFASDALLEIYATGIRNAFDLVWHSNGQIYVPTNGTAAGGSSPGVSAGGNGWVMQSADSRTAQTGYDQGTDVSDVCATHRGDGSYSDVLPEGNDGNVTAHTGLPTQLDYVFTIDEGGYYGHPNPTRCEWVMNNGSDSLSGTGNFYPSGTEADPNYDEDGAYSLDFNKSPNGVIEYQSDTFGGELQGRVMIVRFSNNDDILTMQVAPDGTILGDQAGTTIGGFSGGYADPLELTEDTEVNPGNIYLNQYNRAGEPQQLYLLRVPDGQQATAVEVASNQPPAVGDALVMSATLNNEGPTDTDTVTVSNNGTETVDITGAVVGADAGQFSLASVGTIPAGESVDVDVTFDPSGSVGIRTATLEFTAGEAVISLAVRALAHAGQEGGEEPTLQQVFDTFDFGLDSGWSGLAGGTDPAPVGDEVDLDLFERASDGPVVVTPVAAYAPFEDLPFGWFAETTGSATLNEVGVLPDGQQQTLVPDSNPAAPLEFDPGTDAFGFYYDSNTFNRVGYTEDARNTDGVAHRARIYPLPGDAFYVAFEDAANGDYQDYDFILENVVAAGEDPVSTGDAISVNFQLETAPVPTGYVRDFGEAYGPRTGANQGTGLTYGWVDDETFEPLSLVGNGRDRELNDDQRLDTLMHMDLPPDGNGGVLNDGTWELAVANGSYEVTVAVGDPDLGSAPETHTINVEGTSVIDAFPKSTAPDGSDARHSTATATVEVTDGKLTVDQIGGTNTKINYLTATPLTTGGGGDTVAQVNFQPSGSPTPTDWVADSGQLFSAGRGYGWVDTEGGADKTADTRDRAADSDPLDGTTIIVDDAQVASVVNGDWEYALANGTYEVTVSVGDPEYADSTHGVTAEGTSVVSGFTPTGAGDYQVGTAVVEVTDGALTLSSSGTNTKLQWVTIATTGGGDVIPPQVAINLDGPGNSGAFTGPVSVTLDITDSSLEFVDVSIDGTQDASINAQNFATPFEVSGTGNHVVEVTATDGAGNATTETAEFSIIETGDGELTLTNPEAAPFDDRLVMSRIQSTAQGPATNETATIQLGNDGSEDLVVTDLAIADADDFELVSPPDLPATIAVGGSVDVEVLFDGVGSGANALLESTLTVTHDGNNGPATPVELAGQWQTRAEQGNEPNVAEIVEAFGFGTTIVGPGQQINNQGRLEAIGDEVLSRTWAQADEATPVTVRQLAAYHTCCSNTAAFGWHPVGNKGSFNQVLRHDGQWAQTLLPRINNSDTTPAVASFDPGPSEFSLRIDPESGDWTLNNTGPDQCGGGNAGCQLGHHLRVWPSEDRDGDRIPHQWIVVMDYSGINYDFNDNVYLVDNLKPTGALVPGAPAAPTGVAASLEGGSVRLDWDANSEDDLDGYHVERSVEGASFERITSDPIGSSTYLDTAAPAESTIEYRVVAVDQADEESGPSNVVSIDTPEETVDPIRINAGGPQVDYQGATYAADSAFVGGKVFENSSATVPALYQSERSATTNLAPFDYAIDVENGTYTVTLHFAEIWFGANGGGPAGSGQRVFSANLEGGPVELADYDINDDVGSQTPVTKSFDVEVTDGVLDIAFTATTNQPKVSAIEVLPGDAQ